MDQFRFRIGTSTDIDEVVDGGLAMLRETGDGTFDRSSVVEGAKKILSNPERGFYVIAERDGVTAGSLHVGMQWLDLVNGCLWWISCVYVKPPYRRQGCYRGMYRYVEDLARKNQDARGLRLLVHPKNTRAIATYEGLGMVINPYPMYVNNFF